MPWEDSVIKQREGTRGDHPVAVVGEARLPHLRELHRAKALLNTGLGLNEEEVFACRLAITEAITNAFLHGRCDAMYPCRVQVEREINLVRVIVEDHGPGFQWQGLHPGMPKLEAENGRGIYLMCRLMDRVAIRSTKTGTRVELVKLLPANND